MDKSSIGALNGGKLKVCEMQQVNINGEQVIDDISVPISESLPSQDVIVFGELATPPIVKPLQEHLEMLLILQVENGPCSVHERAVRSVVAAHPGIDMTGKGQFPEPDAVHFHGHGVLVVLTIHNSPTGPALDPV
jgi:hypothetical protein